MEKKLNLNIEGYLNMIDSKFSGFDGDGFIDILLLLLI